MGGAVVLLVWWTWSSSNDPETKEKRRARDAISLCWEDQGKKSLSPGQARFVAGTCERMEAEFTQKYGVRP